MRIALGELIELARERGVTDDPVIRQRLAQIAIEVELLRLNAWRGLTAIMKTGIPGPGGLGGQVAVVGELNQSLTELAVDILGEDGAPVGLALDLPLPALARQLDRGRHHRDPQEHRRRARARPAEAALGGHAR